MAARAPGCLWEGAAAAPSATDRAAAHALTPGGALGIAVLSGSDPIWIWIDFGVGALAVTDG